MARSGSRRKHRAKGRRGGNGASGAVLVVAFVLAGAAAVAWYYRADLGLGTSVSSESATAATPAQKPPPAVAPEPPPADESGRFEFYDMLPDAEVEIAAQPRTSGAAQPPPVSVPGTYVVQAGAFPNFAEADKVKARLALLGVASEIQAADANGKRFHRVRIGPLDDLAELNRLRGKLRQNGIEFLVIPVGE